MVEKYQHCITQYKSLVLIILINPNLLRFANPQTAVQNIWKKGHVDK